MTLCSCEEPAPGAGEHNDHCRQCGDLIGQAIIGGEVHAGYTSLGNGQAFFDAKERWSLNTGDSGVLAKAGERRYFRTFGDAEVVVPHHHEKAQKLGTEHVSFDPVVLPDGSVDLVVLNRRIENLPDGPKFPEWVDD